MSTSSEKANLARIRDNQRRSRARRKEYLQELESRLRQCELQGVEASSEIQSAARRVAEENKKLRALLAQHGVRDESIEVYLQRTSTADTVMGGQYGSHSEPVQVLEQLLSTPKACCTDGSNPSGGGQSCDRDSSGSVTTTQSTWDPSQTANPRRRSGIQQAGRVASMQYMTPSGSTTSSSPMGHSSASHAMSQHQRLVSAQMGRHMSPGSNAPSQNHQVYDYDQQFSLSNRSYSSIQSNTPKHQYQTLQQSSSVYVPTTSSSNVNNCNYAAELITTMAGVSDSSAVRADLGCSPGMDCEVDNQLVFNVMDRYSGVGL
ncbi:hypothetical protein ONS95_011188 [Cadophora gregata]|uniref:uncharacterized protein n=1 Tax=Cadophora gregata TaxID=51156 RepID=UPI0026DD7D9F|nr:uncharacterized protein ONS95_011188 [Cadophora gregata]KAK0119754.1 hypothetical protein ONS95_011188 [Cadophora gregata]KAK0120788.1 hypothetical protein ONS96_010990 [Cadophora gregata f. sp. sojae]